MEQQEPDVVFPRPSLQKHKHAKTASSDFSHLREFKDNNPGVGLRGHGIAQLISGFSFYNSSLAPKNRQFTYVCNGYIQHDFLPALVLSSTVLSTPEHGQCHSFILCNLSLCFLENTEIPRRSEHI